MKPIIAPNWKMHFTVEEAKSYYEEIRKTVEENNIFETVVFPTFLHFSELAKYKKIPHLSLGCQNFYDKDKGAFTGEVSLEQLKEFCSYALVGHSERRGIFCETDDMIHKKLVRVFEKKLTPILCIGEHSDEREKGKTKEKITFQLQKALEGITIDQPFIVAYEPIWAIGTGKIPTPSDIDEAFSFIEETLLQMHGNNEQYNLLYGGSVNESNIINILQIPRIKGVLIGTACVHPQEFISILELVKSFYSNK